MKSKSSMTFQSAAAACLIFAAYPQLLAAQTNALAGTSMLSYADLADLSDAAPIVALTRIRSIIAIPAEEGQSAPQGHKRVYVEAEVINLIRGEGGISPVVRYLYDAPLDARGKLPKLKKTHVILFARRADRPGDIQLVARDAQIPAAPATVEQVKAILSDLMAERAPPRIVQLGDAFHVAGTVADESETQIFLRTASGEPVSLSILRRPGQEPKWAVALGEIVDEAARPPEPGTLLWYRLACGLPPTLPAYSSRALSPTDAEAARADYALVIQSLGNCGRTRFGS
ncbi:hypothetical protein BV98_001965 [Sphingobium herbicidovorans NBRC 16415]|uniref:Uncharacterized protein n=2 Tax=Sphingobium herbicidovorans TaxID=76947 RepID=A0A086P9U4_SPHHM|nr:hypothetical protein [Sphingobium herbicidovorans]KFG90162.1 hypothetical protein BV98_001965 [Sphingobium herbicidovorans NBRC 16415]